MYIRIFMYLLITLQIIHLRDFAFWRIFQGLNTEEIEKRQSNFDYPPRLQIECVQIDPSKSLYSSFEISKTDSNNIANFPVIKKAAGSYKPLEEKLCTIMLLLLMYS